MNGQQGEPTNNFDSSPSEHIRAHQMNFWTAGKAGRILLVEVPVNCREVNWLEQLTDEPPKTWRQALEYVSNDGYDGIVLYGNGFWSMGFEIDALEIVGAVVTGKSGYSADFDIANVVDEKVFAKLILRQCAKYIVLTEKGK